MIATAETPALVGFLAIKEATHNALSPNHKPTWEELSSSKEPSDGTGGKPELSSEGSRMLSCTSRSVMMESTLSRMHWPKIRYVFLRRNLRSWSYMLI